MAQNQLLLKLLSLITESLQVRMLFDKITSPIVAIIVFGFVTFTNKANANPPVLNSSLSEVHRSHPLPLGDIYITAPELIVNNGYPFESHDDVVTKDGYVLTLHRIPAPGKPVVMFYHGLGASSRDFLMNRKHIAPAYKLFEAGFDVWLVNSRGNSYSQAHEWLNFKDPEYWDFSVDDNIKYDAPAMIDYILMMTGQKKLNFIGHSLGTSVGLGLAASQPEYNEKINLFILLGVTTHIPHVGNKRSLFLKFARPMLAFLKIQLDVFNRNMPPLFLNSLSKIFNPITCFPEARMNTTGICSFFVMLVVGIDVDQLNPELIPVVLGSSPGRLSTKTMMQLLQWFINGEFSYLDCGRKNEGKYGSSVPPIYDLTKVTARVVNFYSSNDLVSVPQDVLQTIQKLPNVVLNIKVESQTWNHLDYIFGKDADVYVYDKIIIAINTLK